MIREIALFGEDSAHRQIIDALVNRLAKESNTTVRLNWVNAQGGHGQVVDEFNTFLRDLRRHGGIPDLIVVATDADCIGVNERRREFEQVNAPAPIVLATPDPHVERWLLLDGAAFREVFGRGCDAPDQRCDRDLYKQRLISAIYAAGITPTLGGIEFAEDIVQYMNIDRAMRSDDSLRRFVSEIRQTFRQWQA